VAKSPQKLLVLVPGMSGACKRWQPLCRRLAEPLNTSAGLCRTDAVSSAGLGSERVHVYSQGNSLEAVLLASAASPSNGTF